jgi:hypothetical protein
MCQNAKFHWQFPGALIFAPSTSSPQRKDEFQNHLILERSIPLLAVSWNQTFAGRLVPSLLEQRSLSFGRAVQISELFGSVGLILLDELQRQTGFVKPGWVATFVEFVGVAVLGAKTEAFFPGRVPHVRPSVHGLKKTGRSSFECFFECGEDTAAKSKSPSPWKESIGRIRFRPMVPDFLNGAPPTDALAAFIKESRMKFVNARELDRKSGCTLRRTLIA